MNIMTKYGETHNYTGRDFVQRLEEALGREVDGILWNSNRATQHVLEQYRRQKADCVELDPADPSWGRRRVYAADLLESSGGIVRHDPAKLAGLIRKIIDEGKGSL